MSVGDAEESYRAANDAPKVVTKTVVKEVIRNVGSGGKLVALEGVYSGRLKKIVIVTGDRGTGVTSTAYNLAQTLAKKVDVLYFDCDIDNHGLLSYIDYANFKNYENNHMNGTKLCRTSQAFDTCVISWDTNLYLLTSDYTCDTTVEELQRTSEIVAERATDFGVVVVDCPIEKLNYIKDLILTGQSITCVEGSKRGFMNMLCQLERSTLPTRFKRTLVARGNLFVTKCSRNLDLKKLVAFIRALFEPADVDWLSQNIVAFDGKLTDKLLNDILEG
jgi:cellulose biosynthesis protein BcsQ